MMKAKMKQRDEEVSISKESRVINKKIKQEVKLQKIEMQLLERLKETYAKQQETIEEIQDVF